MAVYEFTPEQIAEIESARKTATNKKAVKHLEALSLYALGIPVKQVAEKTGVCATVIHELVHKYQKQGLAMLSGRLYVNSEWYTFTAEQLAEIEAAYHAATDVRTARYLKILLLCAGDELARKVAKAFGVGRTTVVRLVYDYKDKGLEAVIRRAVKCNQYNQRSTSEQMATLRSMLDSTTCRRTARRIRALLLWDEGKSRKDIAATTGLSTSYIDGLIMKFRDNGVAGIEPKPRKRPFAAPKYKFTDQQKAEIEAMRGLVTDEREAKKLEALWLRTEKKNLPEISTITGLHKHTVYDVIRKYHEQGLEAAIRDHRGRRNKK